MESIRKDDRFAHITKDPRFHKMRRKDRKVKIDKRFKGMFDDKRFKLKYTVDKRGRPIHATTNENLRKYYDLSGSDDNDDDDNENEEISGVKKNLTKVKETKQKKVKDESSSPESDENSEEESSKHSDDEEEEEEGKKAIKSKVDIDVINGPDLARGEGDLSSSSDEDDDDEEENDDSNKDSDSEELPWGEMDHDAPEAEDITHRLALCNMDWDRIKAQDLMMTFDSFKPPGGVIRSVTIYPSEFGLKRMKEEELKGPTELVAPETKKRKKDDREYQVEKLRKYQLNRLKYCYAVIDCDSPATANKIYDECDGIEYEGSSATFDLRFIPDDMSFEGQQIKSQVTDAPDASTYKPTLFMNSALQQSKVNLTWDETDRDRVALTQRAFSKDEIDTLDVRDYLASDSEDDDTQNPYGTLVETPDFGAVPDEDEDEESQIQKYRNLLQGIQDTDSKRDQDQDMDMEISWEPGLKETKSKKKKDEQTPWEKYLEKSKDKKQKKRKKKQKEEVPDSEQSDDDDEEEEGISDDELPDGIDLDDPYFKEELDKMSGHSGEKKKKQKKQKKSKSAKESTAVETEEEKRQKDELALLMLEEEQADKNHFSLKSLMNEEKELKGKKKRRNRKMMKQLKMAEKAKQVQDGFELDVKDPRFQDVYQNPLYNIDPTAPEYKKTKAMESLIHEKLSRRKHKDTKKDKDATSQSAPPSKKSKISNTAEEDSSRKTSDPYLASLIKSVKAKTKSAQDKKQKNKRTV